VHNFDTGAVVEGLLALSSAANMIKHDCRIRLMSFVSPNSGPPRSSTVHTCVRVPRSGQVTHIIFRADFEKNVAGWRVDHNSIHVHVRLVAPLLASLMASPLSWSNDVVQQCNMTCLHDSLPSAQRRVLSAHILISTHTRFTHAGPRCIWQVGRSDVCGWLIECGTTPTISTTS
jgi:hypothetical protein